MALPAGFGTTAHPHLLVQTGKDGRVYLLDRDNLGGNAQGAGGTDAFVGPPAGPYNGVWGHPAFWGGDGGYVYQVENQGFLRAFKYGVNGSGLPVLTRAGTSASTFGYTSGSPVVTSTGTTSGSAIVWVVYSDGSNGANGQLRAYDALPVNGQLNLRYSAPIGTATKFATPGHRRRPGLRRHPRRPALRLRPAHHVGADQPPDRLRQRGRRQHRQRHRHRDRDPRGDHLRHHDHRAVRRTPPSLPRSLTTGQTLAVPVRFTPTATGGATGSLTFTTDSGTVAFDLHGTGTQAGLGATPSAWRSAPCRPAPTRPSA